MARDKSPADSLFDDIVKRAVTATLKPHGFRKSALSFHRRNKDVVQVVNLQSSHGSAWDEKAFYINVGLAFDAICKLTDNETKELCKLFGDRQGINQPKWWIEELRLSKLAARCESF